MLLLCGQISMWMSAAPAGGLFMWLRRWSIYQLRSIWGIAQCLVNRVAHLK